MGGKQSTARLKSKNNKQTEETPPTAVPEVLPEDDEQQNNHCSEKKEKTAVEKKQENNNSAIAAGNTTQPQEEEQYDHDTLAQMETTKRRSRSSSSIRPLARASTSSSSRHSRGSRDSRVSSKRMSFYDIVDADDITSYLIVGNQASAQDEEFLIRKKVMFILNLSNLPLEYINPDIEYKSLFLEDEDDSDLLSVLQVCLQALQEWKMKCLETKARILVYSYNGLSRSCAVVLGHLMTEERLTLKQAWNHLKEKHPIAKPNDGFQLQLMQYEQGTLNRKLSMTIAEFYCK